MQAKPFAIQGAHNVKHNVDCISAVEISVSSSSARFTVPILPSFLPLLAKLAVNSEALCANGKHCEPSAETQVSDPAPPSLAKPAGV